MRQWRSRMKRRLCRLPRCLSRCQRCLRGVWRAACTRPPTSCWTTSTATTACLALLKGASRHFKAHVTNVSAAAGVSCFAAAQNCRCHHGRVGLACSLSTFCVSRALATTSGRDSLFPTFLVNHFVRERHRIDRLRWMLVCTGRRWCWRRARARYCASAAAPASSSPASAPPSCRPPPPADMCAPPQSSSALPWTHAPRHRCTLQHTSVPAAASCL